MSTIANTQAMMGYQPANTRRACRNCKHVEQRDDKLVPDFYCKQGGFLTRAGAICLKYAAKAKS